MRLQRFIRDNTGREATVSDFTRFPTGLSWITASFRLHGLSVGDGCQFILKIAPPAGLLAPYDVMVQVDVLKLFAGTDVPVPAVRWHSEEASILGAPFFVCDHLAGQPVNPFESKGLGVAQGEQSAVGLELADILASIHRTEWRGSRLGAPIDPETSGPATALREIEYWRSRIVAGSTKPYPLLDYAYRWLLRNQPEQARTAVVHGDYRVGNFLVHEARISAILDWEMAHIGDPYEDLSWVLLRQFRLNALIDPAHFVARYEAAVGWSVSAQRLAYYEVLARYKLVGINVGAIANFERGSNDARTAVLGAMLPLDMISLVKALRRHHEQFP